MLVIKYTGHSKYTKVINLVKPKRNQKVIAKHKMKNIAQMIFPIKQQNIVKILQILKTYLHN